MIDLNYLYCYSNLSDEEDEVILYDYLTVQALVKEREQNLSRYYEGVIAERICDVVDNSNSAIITGQDKFLLLFNKMGGNLHDFINSLSNRNIGQTNIIDKLFYALDPNSRIFSSFNELRARGNIAFFKDVQTSENKLNYQIVSDENYLFTKPLKMFGFDFFVNALKDVTIFDSNDFKQRTLNNEQIITLCIPLIEDLDINVLQESLPMFELDCLKNTYKNYLLKQKDDTYFTQFRTELYKEEYNAYFGKLWNDSNDIADGLINIDIDGFEDIDCYVDGSETVPYSQYVLEMQEKMKFKIEDKQDNDLKPKFIATIEQCNQFCDDIIGHDIAKNVIVDKLMSVSCGFTSKEKPVATFLLNGPTGVGKTQTAKSLANNFLNGKIYTIDMTNFKHEADMSIFTGSPPGYVGYNDKNAFIEFIKANPNCVLLFDEIDKAAPSVLPFMMRLLDEGKFNSAKGEIIDVSNCIIIATTNQKANISVNSANKNLEELSAHSGERGSPFLNEFMGRFDEILDYESLTNEDLKEILIQKLDKRIKEFESQNVTGIKIAYGEDLLDEIIRYSNSKVTGARALNSGIQRFFIRPLSRFIIENKAYGANIVVESQDCLLVDNEEVIINSNSKKKEKKSTYENELNYFA